MKNAQVKELQEVLAELIEIMRTEGDLHDWPWVLDAQRLAYWADKEPEALAKLKALIKWVPTGMGTLYDIVIWRDTFEERKEINNRFNYLRRRFLEIAESL